MQKIVVDSSVIVKWINQQNEELLINADRLMRDVYDGKAVLFAPELAKYEIGNALVIRKKLSMADYPVVFDTLFSLPIQFVDQSLDLACATYAIASDLHVTYYDASFIALAKQEAAILVTDNVKHQGKAIDISVIPLQSY